MYIDINTYNETQQSVKANDYQLAKNYICEHISLYIYRNFVKTIIQYIL